MCKLAESKFDASQELKLFDVVITRSGPESPRFVAGLGKDLYVASGLHLDILKRMAPDRTRVIVTNNFYAITAKKMPESDILEKLRKSGLRYSAFGEENPYPHDEAILIARWESHVTSRWERSVYDTSQVKQDGRFLWLEVQPVDCGHRECESHGVVAFPTEEAAASFVSYLSLPRGHSIGAAEVLGYVFDPDLGLGDFGIDDNNPEAIPGRIGAKAKKFRPGRFRMGSNGVVPTEFRPGMFE